jgi:hypothetical protein
MYYLLLYHYCYASAAATTATTATSDVSLLLPLLHEESGIYVQIL